MRAAVQRRAPTEELEALEAGEARVSAARRRPSDGRSAFWSGPGALPDLYDEDEPAGRRRPEPER